MVKPFSAQHQGNDHEIHDSINTLTENERSATVWFFYPPNPHPPPPLLPPQTQRAKESQTDLARLPFEPAVH